MVSGHSYLPNDRDFSSIESSKRRTQVVYVPDEWYTLVENCRRINPFTVVRMKSEDFITTKPILKCLVNRKVTTTKQKVNWHQIQWFRVEKSKPLQFQYKCSHNELESWKTVSLAPKRKGRPSDISRVALHQLYDGPRNISPAKLHDLLELLDYVPPIHHSFYRALEASDREESDSDDGEYDERDEDD